MKWKYLQALNGLEKASKTVAALIKICLSLRLYWPINLTLHACLTSNSNNSFAWLLRLHKKGVHSWQNELISWGQGEKGGILRQPEHGYSPMGQSHTRKHFISCTEGLAWFDTHIKNWCLLTSVKQVTPSNLPYGQREWIIQRIAKSNFQIYAVLGSGISTSKMYLRCICCFCGKRWKPTTQISKIPQK